jgi:endonuclease G
MKKYLLLLIVAFHSSAFHAGVYIPTSGGGTQPALESIGNHPNRPYSNCSHLNYGIPKQSSVILCRTGYAIGYNNNLKSADWVSYVLDRELTEGVMRLDNFRIDPDIAVEFQTTPKDYDEPIYHQGHLANSESIDQTAKANDETFYMSNMTPQLPGHNTGIWKGLENRERKWANKRGQVIVVSGPVYHEEYETIGNGVPIPSAYWKVIYDPIAKEAIAYLIPHKKLKTAQLDNYLVSIDLLEDMYDLDLLSKLEDELENKVEKITQPKQW